MIFGRFRRAPARDSIAALYGAIVAQARRPVFYTRFGVPDTAAGRLEMILLHAALVVSRLDAGVGETRVGETRVGETRVGEARALGQHLFDWFCSDMDANLREMGVGDLAVPRKMKAIAEAFYGRKRAYGEALAASEPEPLIAALRRNVPQADTAGQPCLAPMAAYVCETHRTLAITDFSSLLQGRLAFPDPERFAHAPAGTRSTGAQPI